MTRLSRDDIITGAGRRFATHGYHGTSMRDLGEDLGILGSSIYAHVGGKQELLIAVIERGASYFEESADRAVADGDGPSSTLRLLVVGHIDVVLDHRAEARTYLSETDFLEVSEQARVTGMRQRYEAVFVDTIRRGVAEGEFDPDRSVRLSAIYVLSILNAVDRWFSDSGALTRAAFAHDLCGFVLEGLNAT
ncbi:MAG: TetR/AcrR family transcriptional regulator [Acidimicrobiia bacterium]